MRADVTRERLAMVLTALFLLACAAFFLRQDPGDLPWRVTVSKAEASAEHWTEEENEKEWPASLLPGERIDLNTAPVRDLCRLPQVGAARARAIVNWREAHGPFQNPRQLTEVPGIGEGLFLQLEEYITVTKTD